jgi:hypothetical protein
MESALLLLDGFKDILTWNSLRFHLKFISLRKEIHL